MGSVRITSIEHGSRSVAMIGAKHCLSFLNGLLMELLRRGVIARGGLGNRKVRKRRRQFEMLNRRQRENILAGQVQLEHGAFSVSILRKYARECGCQILQKHERILVTGAAFCDVISLQIVHADRLI